jgi:hypothetical protein
MKLRFGEFPTHHPFPLIVQPLADATFKLVSWLLIVATFRYAYDKTGNPILWYVYWTLQLLLLIFVYSCVEWIFNFQFTRRKAAQLSTSSTTFFKKIRPLVVLVLSVGITFVSQMAATQTITNVMEAVVEFQKSGQK